MVDRLYAFCGKIVVQIPPGSEVREGQKISPRLLRALQAPTAEALTNDAAARRRQ